MYLGRFWHGCFVRPWGYWSAIMALSIGSAYYFGLLGTYWALTGEFTRWGGHLLGALGVNTHTLGYFHIIGLHGTPLDRIDGMMLLGMFAGVFCASAWAGSLRFVWFASYQQALRAFVGGVLAGFGARLGMGCNLASFLTGIPQFSLHAWFFTVATLLGVYGGVKVCAHACDLGTQGYSVPLGRGLGVVIFIFVLAWIAYGALFSNAKLACALGFGLGFGFIVARAQICFTNAFRDLFLWGKSGMVCALVVGMMVSSIGVFSYINLGVPPKIMWASPGIFLGGLLFGLGIVLAGGCECGWMYKAMQGQAHFIVVGVGNIVGASLVALSWDHYASWITNYPKINLLRVFGKLEGLALHFGLLLLLLLGVLGIAYAKTRSKPL
ncbi:selenium metabolism membrane protein YedE/FdhT [Helicobacter sp. L8]|uniref:selenium metabolism membrane protein YedE/FdhT n=1 Tax=Helicobacter sp. L8 TaxID=2316078 RepID=UPI000EB302F2|nr:selenium metabolism membrane protein YedE/FdhT [Helicobacter sp. L8]